MAHKIIISSYVNNEINVRSGMTMLEEAMNQVFYLQKRHFLNKPNNVDVTIYNLEHFPAFAHNDLSIS